MNTGRLRAAGAATAVVDSSSGRWVIPSNDTSTNLVVVGLAAN